MSKNRKYLIAYLAIFAALSITSSCSDKKSNATRADPRDALSQILNNSLKRSFAHSEEDNAESNYYLFYRKPFTNITTAKTASPSHYAEIEGTIRSYMGYHVDYTISAFYKDAKWHYDPDGRIEISQSAAYDGSGLTRLPDQKHAENIAKAIGLEF